MLVSALSMLAIVALIAVLIYALFFNPPKERYPYPGVPMIETEDSLNVVKADILELEAVKDNMIADEYAEMLRNLQGKANYRTYVQKLTGHQ